MAQYKNRRQTKAENTAGSLKAFSVALWEDEGGQDLLEYALTVGFVAVAAAAIFPNSLMPNVSTIFSKIESSMTAANGS